MNKKIYFLLLFYSFAKLYFQWKPDGIYFHGMPQNDSKNGSFSVIRGSTDS